MTDKECVTGCIEKPTFKPDKKKKSFWKKIKEWWIGDGAPSPSSSCGCK